MAVAFSFMETEQQDACETVEKKLAEADDILVFATAEDCGICGEYLDQVEIPDPSNLPEEMVQIDISKCPKLVEVLGIDYTPAILRVSKGKVSEVWDETIPNPLRKEVK